MSYGDAIKAHVETHLGPVAYIHKNPAGLPIPIDVLHIMPREDRDFHTLVTSGMSAQAMTPPAENKDLAFAELLICLPTEWSLTGKWLTDSRHNWPMQLLCQLAYMPHSQKTWLSWGHTVPNGNPARPYSTDSDFVCSLVIFPATARESFLSFPVRPGQNISFYGVILLYQSEMDRVLKDGPEKFLPTLQANKIFERIELSRKPCV